MIAYINSYLLSSAATFPTPTFSWEPETAETPPGSVSFTRATTATVLTTTDGTTNWYQTAKSGEIRYEGLRRVENLETNGDHNDLTSLVGGVTKSAEEYTFPGTDTGEYFRTTSATATSDAIGTIVGVRIELSLTSGSAPFQLFLTGTDAGAVEINLTSTPQTFFISGARTSLGATQFRVRNLGTGGPFAATVVVGDYQVEYLQSSSDSPSEFIDPSTTYNANVAGVQYFATTNGNTVDGNGVVTEAAGSAITGGGYLAEPASTNQMPTVDLNDAAWLKQGITVTENGINDLGVVEYQLDAGVAASSHRVVDTASVGSSGSGYFIVKAGTAQFITVRRGASTTTEDYAAFDIVNGTITEEAVGIDDASIIDLGNGWYKCAIITSDTSAALQLAISDSGTPGVNQPSFTGANETVLVCHAQYEANDFPTSPIVTSGSTVTRNADVLSADSEVTGETELSFFGDVTAPTLTSDSPAFMGFGGADRSYITATLVRHSVEGGGVNLSKVTPGVRFQSAIRVAENDMAFALDGVSTLTDTSTNPVTLTDFDIGFRSNLSAFWRGRIHKVQVYNQGLSNTDLETLVA